MATKVTFDTTNKLIVCNAGVTELDVKVDLYSDMKEDWRNDSDLNKFRFPFRVIGGDETVPPEIAPLFACLRYGWRVRPQEAAHTLRLKNGALLVDEDPGLDPVVPTQGDYNVMVRDVVPIRGTQIETGVSGLTGEESAQLSEIFSNVEFIKAIEGGRWKIENNQMIFYEDDNLTEVCRFNLFDKQGQAAEESVYERKRT